MTSIVTTHYRYKRPPRKRKPVALDMPAVVAAKSSRRTSPVGGKGEAAAEVLRAPFRKGQRSQAHRDRQHESFLHRITLLH